LIWTINFSNPAPIPSQAPKAPTRRLIEINIDPSKSIIIEIDHPTSRSSFLSTIDLIEIDLDIGRKLRTLGAANVISATSSILAIQNERNPLGGLWIGWLTTAVAIICVWSEIRIFVGFLKLLIWEWTGFGSIVGRCVGAIGDEEIDDLEQV
jgi:hypothetical protein